MSWSYIHAPDIHPELGVLYMSSWKKRLAYLAVGTVTAAGLSGAFGQVAFAANTPAAAEPEFTALAQTLLAEDDVQAVAQDGLGQAVVYTTAPVSELSESARALVAQSGVTTYVLDGPLTAYDTDDVVGGAGYFSRVNAEANSGGSCSIGFSAWTGDGEPAVVSAGHCTDDGAFKRNDLTLPTSDPAGGGSPDGPVTITQPIGTLAFSQFGGPGDSEGAEGSETSVDVSVIEVTNDALNTLPEVTDWTTAESEDLSESTIKVKAVGSAEVGAEVSKSGRTTGFTSGNVQSVDGWAKVRDPNDPNAIRWVYGFGALVDVAPGDSGGSIIQGSTAVGITSAGGEIDGQSFLWGADLQAGLAVAGDYTVSVFLDAPKVTLPEGGEVETGTDIQGTGPAGSTLVVTEGSKDPFEVAIDGNGNWAFPAPGNAGDYSYSIQAKKGFDRSAATSFDVTVVLAPLKAPVISSPVSGERVLTEVSAITGTGEPGAEIVVTGDVEATTTVGSDGKWKVEEELSYGQYSISVTQSREGEDPSPAATADFAVVPAAPSIVSPGQDNEYTQGEGPAAVTGKGITGAKITASVNGSGAGTATVKDGKWSIALKNNLPVGTITINAVQTIAGVTSDVDSVSFTVVAANNGGGGNGGGGNGGGGNNAGGGGNGGGSGSDGGQLASTGAEVSTPLVGGGIALLLGAGALLLVRRTQTARRSN
jgi:LPXTG-motif cell wall-anchored protein